MLTRHRLLAGVSALVAASLALPAAAQDTIKLGELNSYKVFAAFLEPYKKGMELAVDEVNAAGGVLGKQDRDRDPRRQRQARAMPCASPRSC